MCGIAGIVALNANAAGPSRDALLRMVGSLAHRGPDGQGVYRDQRAGLAHARLSIIDIAGGQQPLSDPEGPAWIVFNGEVFNYVELREQLTSLGHRFRTRSDTEVVVQAYRAWGEAAFERMNGQWALAIWDASDRRLVLSRDRTGICPLYICHHQDQLYFASEIKAIFAANPRIPRAIDPAGIDQTFTFWSTVPPQSVFRGITEIEPGHVRSYAREGVRDRAFWTPSYPYRSEQHSHSSAACNDDVINAVRHALETATALRVLRSDVPVGSYLSGGLDSSLVAALGSRFAGRRFQTFSVRFADAEYDETSHQRLMARTIASEHHELMVTRQDIAEAFSKVIYHTERPILRTAPVPLFLLSKLVRERGVKIVLTGEGADEVFAGYDLFREGKIRRFWGRSPASMQRAALLKRLYPYISRSPVHMQAVSLKFFGHGISANDMPGFAHQPRWRSTSAIKRLFSADMRDACSRRDPVAELLDDLHPDFLRWTPLAQDQYLESKTLLAGYLLSSQGDRMLMAHSVEGRFPFLDNDVVELANSLPDPCKLHILDEKHVLKRAAQSQIPAEIVRRKKQPYRTPNALCFVGKDSPSYVDEALSGACIRAANIFDPVAIERLRTKCRTHAQTGDGDLSNFDNMALVGVLSTQLLFQQFVADRPEGRHRLRLCVDVDLQHPSGAYA